MFRDTGLLAYLLAVTAAARAGSLRDVKHIVLFMQENRAFDHARGLTKSREQYFGTMAGVRGFGDPHVQINPDGRSTFEQAIQPRNGVSISKPWHINYLGGEWTSATQCMGAGDNGWGAMHSAFSGGRQDIPIHFDIAEGMIIDNSATPGGFSESISTRGSNTDADAETVLIISYGEQGRWADHVVPPVAPKDTPGEWLKNPYNEFGDVPLGPVGSGSGVSRSLHRGAYTEALTPWRRQHMSNLVTAFDFNDVIIPMIARQRPVGPAKCLQDHKTNKPPVPYGAGNANQTISLLVEEGFKSARGQLTEGRFLTFEMYGFDLTNVDGKSVGTARAGEKHDDLGQR
ncbi:hypothetical protein E4U58_000641 [Claviceps cyperi]|nr:hypothetical protein E4U58_000641 [Claviceps cyperi]